MPVFSEQFYQIDPFAPPGQGTLLQQQFLQVSNVAGSGSINNLSSAGTTAANGDRIDNTDITAIYRDTITVTMNGSTINISGATFYLADGRRFFSPTDGTNLDPAIFEATVSTGSANSSIAITSLGPPCFTLGTLIAVPNGQIAIETLTPGDLVETMDHGPQVLRWIGRKSIAGTREFAPVRIEAGSLGNDRTLLVSPEHRMLMSGWKAELLFGEAEILVAAKHLVGHPGISRTPVAEIEYFHLLFDRHEIVFAEGAPSESFYPSSILLEQDRTLRDEIEAIFPEMTRDPAHKSCPLARRAVAAHEARLLAA
ncbi:MAG: Hint domain-containing protein [Albidovulum sp.]